ncbi:MAG: hypothetical protein IJO71_09550 [Microbacterium sp.]|uniref:beta-sandwich lipoprotein n=1 Tax=Microbacterium sp. TaxID=51671 RepID=UPI0025E67587|nr:hypothetical protein [Microbacterium sp.]MBQ9917426.1 hypothetical protein [Microbacterium sp.]
MKINRGIAAISIAAVAALGLSACTSDADTASKNISTAAEAFEVQRTIVGINGITGATIFYAEGRCSVESAESFLPGAVEVTCKYGPDEYRKHFVMLGDQDSLSITQEKSIDVSEYHTRIVLKLQNVIPEFDIMVGEDQ